MAHKSGQALRESASVPVHGGADIDTGCRSWSIQRDLGGDRSRHAIRWQGICLDWETHQEPRDGQQGHPHCRAYFPEALSGSDDE